MSIETKCLTSQACLAPVSQLFLKPLLCSAKANVQRIQQETLPVLLLPLSQLLLEFKGSTQGLGQSSLHLSELRAELFKVHNEEKEKKSWTPKNYLESPATAPQQTFACRKTRFHPPPRQGMRYKAAAVRIPLHSPKEPRGKEQNTFLHEQPTHFSCCLCPCHSKAHVWLTQAALRNCLGTTPEEHVEMRVSDGDA